MAVIARQDKVRRNYRLADGTRVPGVTTILGIHHPGGIEGLLVWANRIGQEGKSHREERDKALEAGTLTHHMAEMFIRGIDPYNTAEWVEAPELIQHHAKTGFEAFLLWLTQTQLDIVDSEVELVSEAHRFGGTIDCIAAHADPEAGTEARVLLDIKTGKSVRAGYITQIAAYKNLWEECHPGLTIDRVELIRFGREYGEFAHHSFPAPIIDLAWDTFRHLRAVYENDKEIRKVVG